MLLAFGCAPAPAPDTRAADEAAIRATDQEWGAAISKRDLDAIVSFYDESAVILPPNAPPVTGKAAQKEFWAGMLVPGMSLAGQDVKLEVAKSGDLAYLYGTYELSITPPNGGPATQDKGKLLEVWKKQADGKWKCVADTFNSDSPAPPTPAK
jgi:ketosteroid isomerase-like protein